MQHFYYPGQLYPCSQCCGKCGSHVDDDEDGCGFGSTRVCATCHDRRDCACTTMSYADIAEYLGLSMEDVAARFALG